MGRVGGTGLQGHDNQPMTGMAAVAAKATGQQSAYDGDGGGGGEGHRAAISRGWVTRAAAAEATVQQSADDGNEGGGG